MFLAMVLRVDERAIMLRPNLSAAYHLRSSKYNGWHLKASGVSYLNEGENRGIIASLSL